VEGDGEEAVALAGKLRPEVVIMDLNLRKLNGIVATRQIIHHLSDIKVIGLSFHDKKEMRVPMIEAGAVDILRKTGGTAKSIKPSVPPVQISYTTPENVSELSSR
jgi:DNA-binding NarL/FixJ family response regulator